MKRDNSKVGRARDWIAWKVANFALRKIATPWFRAMVEGAIKLGLETAAKGK